MTTYFKSGIPLQSGLIERDSLLEKMSRIHQYPLTVLSAPTGSGKTALASQIASQVEADVIWLTITQYEQDLQVFLRLLLKHIDRLYPGMISLQSGIQDSVENIASEISTYLNEVLENELVIVIDDWHLLTQPESDKWLQCLVDTLPPRCRLMILSQNVPRLNMIQLIASQRLLRITQQDLFFTRAELYMLSTQLQRETLSSDEIEVLWNKLRGWPAGTIVALQPIHNLLDTYESIEDDVASMSLVLFQSIAKRMLQQELPDIRHFLSWTSTADIFNQEICETVYGISDSNTIINEVIQRNLFITQQAGGYHYHHLFRSFLQNHFKLTRTNDYLSAHRRIAGWYLSQNQIDKAITHYLEGQSYPEAIELAERIVYAHYAQGRINTILRLQEQLEDYQNETPHLNYVLAQIYLGHEQDLDKAMAYAQVAFEYFQTHQMDDQYDVQVTLAQIHIMSGNLDRAQDILQTVIEQDNLTPELLGSAYNQLGLALYYLGEIEDAVQHLEVALHHIETSGSAFALAKVYQELEMAYRDNGNVAQANDCLQKQIYYWRKLNNAEQLAMALNNLGYRYYEQGQYQHAENAYRQGLETLVNIQSARSRYYLMTSLADLQRDRGQYQTARGSYQRALNLIAEREPYAHIDVLINLSTLYRWQEKYEAALTCAEDAIHLARQHNLNGAYVRARIADWHIRLQPWSTKIIRAEMKAVEADHHRLSTHPSIDYLTLQFRLAHLDTSIIDIHTVMKRLNRLHNREESVQTFVAELLNNKDLKGFWQKIKHQYLQLETARQNRTIEQETPSAVVPMVSEAYSLHVYTLGVERIRKNNTFINLNDFRAERVREFLYYFVFMGSTKRETLEDIVWSDKSSEARRDNFHQTLARLRGTLGSNIIIYDNTSGFYRFNPDVQVWCDALTLESLVTEARHLSRRNQHAFQLWHQATQIPHGEFLSDLDRDWIVGKRQYFHDLHIEAWMGLANTYRKNGDYRSALSAYETLESFAPYHEASYRACMECYAELGEVASIQSTYQRLAERLHRDLQVEPSPQSTRLYRQLAQRIS